MFSDPTLNFTPTVKNKVCIVLKKNLLVNFFLKRNFLFAVKTIEQKTLLTR